MLDWTENENGNYVCHIDGERMTVCQIPASDEWCGRNGDRRVKRNFDTAEKAMEAMERLLDNNTGLDKEIKEGWRIKTDGSQYRCYSGGMLSVKQAKSGKWYACCNGKLVLKNRWFDSAFAAKQVVNKHYGQ